jgi:predicted transcriptional regulator
MVICKYQQIFGKAIAYKVGEMAYNRLLVSPRLNDTTLNIDKDAASAYMNTLVGKYRELMFGTEKAYGNAATHGLRQLVAMTLREFNDKCVVCTAQVTLATATF